VSYRAEETNGREFLIANGKRISESFESVTDPALSRDGRVVAYAFEGSTYVLVVGDKKIPIPEFPRTVFLSRNAEAWGYITARTLQTGRSVVTAGGRSEAFEEIGSPEFDPSARRVAFFARNTDNCFIVIGDRKYPAAGLVDGPFWSDDGKQVGYGALLGREIWWKVIQFD